MKIPFNKNNEDEIVLCSRPIQLSPATGGVVSYLRQNRSSSTIARPTPTETTAPRSGSRFGLSSQKASICD